MHMTDHLSFKMATSKITTMRVKRGRRYDLASQEIVFDLALKNSSQIVTPGDTRFQFYLYIVLSKTSRDFGKGNPKVKAHYVGWRRRSYECRPLSELSYFEVTNDVIRRDELVEHQFIGIAIQE